MNFISKSPVAKTAAITAAVLGAAVLINAALASQSERRNPPKGSFVEVDGVRLHYVEKGTGSPAVLIHGNQTMAEDYEISGVFDLVAKNHRVIAFDRPGFGYSERPRQTIWTAAAQAALIHKGLAHLGVEKPVLVGHSWGALMALTYALDFPADTGAVLLISGYYFASARLDVVMAALPVLGDVLRYTVSPLLGWVTGPLVLKMVFAPSEVAQRFKKKFPFSMALRPSQIRATAGDASLMVCSAARLTGRYEELAMPVAIMAGRGDTVVEIVPQPERLHGMVPQSTLQILDGTGHMLHYEFPETVATTIEALAEQIRTPAGELATAE